MLLSPTPWFLLKPLSLRPAMSVTSAALKLLFCVVVVLSPPPPPPQPAATSATVAAAANRTTTVRVLDLKMCPPLLPMICVTGPILMALGAILERRAAALPEQLLGCGVRVVLALVHQHATRLRSLVAGDDPAPLEHVDQAAGPGVPDA